MLETRLFALPPFLHAVGYNTKVLQSGAAGCEKGFVKYSQRVPQAVLPKQARGTLRKRFTKPLSQAAAAPDCGNSLTHTYRATPGGKLTDSGTTRLLV